MSTKRKAEKLRTFQESEFSPSLIDALGDKIQSPFEDGVRVRRSSGIFQATVKNPDFAIYWEDDLELLKRLNYSRHYIEQPMLLPTLPPIYSQTTARLVDGAYQLSSLGFINAEGRGANLVLNAEQVEEQNPEVVAKMLQNFLTQQYEDYNLSHLLPKSE